MPELSRRTALGLAASGAAGLVMGSTVFPDSTDHLVPRGRKASANPRVGPRGAGRSAVAAENRHAGSTGWRLGGAARRPDDVRLQIAGYASQTSVDAGGTVSFHVTTNPAQAFTVGVYRLGYYNGAGGRLMVTSPKLPGAHQPPPVADPRTGELTCDWAPAWTLNVPRHWTSGLYAAVFTTENGWRGATPFVVRDDSRDGNLLVVLPFATYQAYNQWPSDGRTGKSLYNGFTAPGGRPDPRLRAFQVSFDRPYAGGDWPKRFFQDLSFVRWAERLDLDICYASNTDLHTGRVDPGRYAGLVFTGHDEYWSATMRDRVTRARDGGTSLAYLGANNMYWRVRFEGEGRTMVCYRTTADPRPGGGEPTVRWRDAPAGGAEAEQGLLGVQYNGMVKATAPLVVRESRHWFWSGSGARDGDRIRRIVGGEADGFDPTMPRAPRGVQTLLSASPYRRRYGGSRTQNTSVCETPNGALVFCAGTLNWTYGLNRPGYQDARIEAATANLLTRMLSR